jgi:hypothetical protein
MNNDEIISKKHWLPVVIGVAGIFFCAFNTVAAPVLTAVTVGAQNPNPIQPGGNASYAVTATRTGNGNMDVYFSASGLPTGATASFTPSMLTFGGSTPMALTTALTVFTTSSIAPGTYNFTITGTDGSSHNLQTCNATLIVGGTARSLPQSIVAIDCTQEGFMHLTCTGGAGQSYKIQATTDLGSGVWTDLATVNADMTGLFAYTDLSATNYPVRFYRTSSL